MLNINDILSVSDSFIHLEEFVGRTAETKEFQSIVDTPYDKRDAHKRIIAFYGQAGIGKTMLLDRLEFECLRRKISYTRINFESGIYNNAIEILREMVQELDPQTFKDWMQLDKYWFSSDLNTLDLNVNVQGQEGGFNFQGANVNASGDMVSGDMVAGSKVEIKNNTIHVQTRVASNPLGAQDALTESFIKALEVFVQERVAVILLEGLDHEYCSPKTRIWVYGLLDKIRGLKGFGVLPVVTYFNSPNFEARLRSVTLRAELKPLTHEQVVEYFYARQIPKNRIKEEAASCLNKTSGIPARVYEYVENILFDLEEEKPHVSDRTDDSSIEEQAVLELQQEINVPEPQLDLQEQPLDKVDMMDGSVSITDLVDVQNAIPVGAGVEAAVVVVERQLGEVFELPAVEGQAVTAEAAGEPSVAVDVLSEAVKAEEKESEEPARSVEAVQLIEAKTQVNAEVNPPAQEIPSVQEDMIKEKPGVEVVDQHELPQPDQQPVAEAAAVSTADTQTRADLVSELLENVKLTELQESHKAEGQPTPEDEQRSQEAYRRSKEKLQRMKSEGKSSTAIMVESLLGRQDEKIADVARRCAVLRWFNIDLIRTITDQDFKLEEAQEILHTIASWAFVQNFGYGAYSYRPEVQQYLRSEIQKASPELYVEIHRRAQAYFEKKLEALDLTDEMIWVNLQTEQVTALRENLYYLLHVDVARGFNLLGKLFQSAQRLYMHGEAAILLKFADEVDKSTLSEHYINLLKYYEAALEYSEGETVSAESKLRILMEKPLEDELSAQMLGQLGVIYFDGKKYDEAFKSFEQAQKSWQKLKRERERAKLSNNLGNVYMRKNDLSRAERSFNDALDGLKKVGKPSELAQTLNNLGSCYQRQENLSKALDYYQQSLKIKTSIGDQFGAANTYINLGIVYLLMAKDSSGKKQLEQRQLAVDYYTRSLEIYRTFGARSKQGVVLYKLASLYNEIGDKAKAREYLPDALEIFRDLEMPDLENASKLEKQLS